MNPYTNNNFRTDWNGQYVAVLNNDGTVAQVGVFSEWCNIGYEDGCAIIDIFPQIGPNDDGYIHTEGGDFRLATAEEITAFKSLPAPLSTPWSND